MSLQPKQACQLPMTRKLDPGSLNRTSLSIRPFVAKQRGFSLLSYKTFPSIDRLVPKATSVVRGRNAIPTSQLNIQYWMTAKINAISAVISRRNIFNHITRYCQWLRPPVLVNHYIYAGLSTDFNQYNLQNGIVSIDTYVDQRNDGYAWLFSSCVSCKEMSMSKVLWRKLQ